MDITCFTKNNCKNVFLDSAIPSVCKEEPCVLGVDEAGRGPVLGPMVYGICFCPVRRQEDLKSTGVADSKKLKAEEREKIFDIIQSNNDFIGWSLEIISPVHISTAMFKRPKVSLNEISHNSAISLIKRAISEGVQVSEIYVDTVGIPEKYQAKLEEIFPTLKVTVAKKADALYPCVSGASICAKVARDKTLSEWEFPEGTETGNWGSGYPADPVTKNFLQNSMDPLFGFPEIVRFSWSTAEKIMKEKCIPVTWKDNDEEEEENHTPSVLEFFVAKRKSSDNDKPPSSLPKKHFFFSERCLNTVTDF